jgi:LemA protein
MPPTGSHAGRGRVCFAAGLASLKGSGVMLSFLVFLFLLVAVIGYLIGVYNGLVRVRAAVKLAWSDIDVLLVQRHDELPKLVEVCKQYMQYEGSTLERIMRARSGVDAARSSGSMSSLGTAERELRSGLTGLYAVAENYPQLKASEPFRHLQERISGLETAIADRREVYNDAVNINNVRIATFPDVLVARMGDFPPAQLLHFEADQKADVDLKAAFSA